MKPLAFFLCLFALLTLGLTCYAADQPQTVDWIVPADLPPVLPAGWVDPGDRAGLSEPVLRVAACQTGLCSREPVRRVAKAIVAAAPVRRVAKAIVAARPLRRVGAVLRRVVAPLRR